MLPFTDRLPFPFYWKGVHFVSVQKQTQSVRQLTLPPSKNARKKHYRKLKNTIMTPQKLETTRQSQSRSEVRKIFTVFFMMRLYIG
ncbi:hypothetical protein VCRA2128O305_350035 [Vibrio crassostreae]|nr:hypothetical protein VCRA2113O197_130125 [Vibrio crassostreae]CAK1790379.1 hypothetical protein VCRA2113O196_160008 [Vibrio crassostreae]CAK1918831.1 hypothetical protein VCRA2112O187_230008 [Vibrio crassostreae]CAK1946620.1 hypothetical protein VCRA2110O181_240034 [Vibrio crassostreae]CAK1960863.1 hypothetical protein VCRA2113O220_250040 [Vibrio crassostreae]